MFDRTSLLVAPAPARHEEAFRRRAPTAVEAVVSLEQLAKGSGTVFLRDRRMPGGRGDIDCIAVAPSGVYVICVEDRSGKLRIQRDLRGRGRTLTVDGRDRTGDVDALDRQLAAVRTTLAHCPHWDVPLRSALCFTHADLPSLRTVTFRGHQLLGPTALARQLHADGATQHRAIELTANALASRFPAA